MKTFLTKNIITYLGNKRKLLGFINSEVDKVIKSDPNLKNKDKSDISVFDIFSGSGIVSRSFRLEGYKVFANDLEVYTKPINHTFLKVNSDNVNGFFNDIPEKLSQYLKSINIDFTDQGKNDYERTVSIINSVRDLGEHQSNPYFQLYYSPKDTKNPDFEKERLFYTQENGRFIDSVLDLINKEGIFNEDAKNIILTSLLHKMTININTSGTMKGFHNGWGGKSSVALERILGDIMIEVIDFPKNVQEGFYYNDFAEEIFINNPDLKVDIIYADPPYNQHQYSANYHMLTTAFNNRDYDVGMVGKNKRAGIRTDHNRSDFCKSKVDVYDGHDEKVKGAYHAFSKFIRNIQNHTNHLIVSYNQEGVLSHSEIIDILSMNGENTVSVKTARHQKYKGGKKTNLSNYVVEYLFVVNMNKKQPLSEIKKLKSLVVIETKHMLIVGKFINIKKAQDKFFIEVNENNNFIIHLDDSGENFLVADNLYEIIEESIKDISLDIIDEIESVLYDDFDKKQLLELYIEKGNYEDALKMLSSFKISKHKKYFEEKLELINRLRK